MSAGQPRPRGWRLFLCPGLTACLPLRALVLPSTPGFFMSLIQTLIRHEGQRRQAYDDATGETLRPGLTLMGHPTIGAGRNLLDPGITEEELLAMLTHDVQRLHRELSAYPWFARLDGLRREVLINMGMMGVPKVLTFARMIAALERGAYAAAADEILDSRYARQVGARALELAAMMRTGEPPR